MMDMELKVETLEGLLRSAALAAPIAVALKRPFTVSFPLSGPVGRLTLVAVRLPVLLPVLGLYFLFAFTTELDHR